MEKFQLDVRQEIANNISTSVAKNKDDILRQALDNFAGAWTYEDVREHGQCKTYTDDPNEYWYFKGTLVAVFTPVEFLESQVTFKYWSYK